MADYTKGLYKQLEDLIIRFESLQSVLEEERQEHKEEIQSLKNQSKEQMDSLLLEHKKEVRLLKKYFKEQMDSLRLQHEEETNTLKAALEEANRTNELLKNEIERLKRKDNNDSSNSSNPPSSDGPGKRANTYNGRKKSSTDPENNEQVLIGNKFL